MAPIIKDAVARGIEQLDGRYFTSLRQGEDNCAQWSAECYLYWYVCMYVCVYVCMISVQHFHFIISSIYLSAHTIHFTHITYFYIDHINAMY